MSFYQAFNFNPLAEQIYQVLFGSGPNEMHKVSTTGMIDRWLSKHHGGMEVAKHSDELAMLATNWHAYITSGGKEDTVSKTNSNAGQWGVAKILKTDNGYNGVIQNDSERGLWVKGEGIFNRQFHPFPKGTLMNVTIRISAGGRKMVQKVEAVGAAVSGEEARSAALEKEWRAKSKAAPTAADIIAQEMAKRMEAGAIGAVYSPLSFDTEEEMVAAVFKPAELENEEETGATVFRPTVNVWEEELVTPLEKAKARVAAKRAARTATSPITGYHVSSEARLVFSAAYRMSQAKSERAVKMMMIGPSGYGKTTLPKLFAEIVGMDFLRMNCATIRDPEEWFGYREAIDGSTIFIRTQFAKAIEKGNLVVVLDEFNRLEPWLHNTLFPLLDDDGKTVVHDEEFRIGPNVIVVGTMNTGHKYTGVFELDEALLNRFEFILEVGPLQHSEEVKVLRERTGVSASVAAEVVKMATALRNQDVVCSTRTTLLVGSMVSAGLSVRQAYECAVVRRIPSDSVGSSVRKSVVDLVNSQLGVFETATEILDVFAPVAEDAPTTTPEPVQEDSASSATYRLEVYKKASTIGLIALIKAIRALPHVAGRPSLRDAKDWAEVIDAGNTMQFDLTEQPDNIMEIAAHLTTIGVSGTFSKIR